MSPGGPICLFGRSYAQTCVQKWEMRQERRVTERYPAILPIEFHRGVLVGYGNVMNISLSGARIEEVNYRPLLGKRLKLLVCLDQAKEPVELLAEVVRYTESEGFAVKFPDLDVLHMILTRINELSQKPD